MGTGSKISIALITGGPTSETEGTRASTEALAGFFEAGSYDFAIVDLDRFDDTMSRLTSCDVIFNAVHGRGGEDGGVHFLAALAGDAPVTGPPWWVHSLGADKVGFKAWARQYVRVPRNHDEPGRFPHGVVRKPRFGGGSIGLEVLPLDSVGAVANEFVIEEFIPGRIVTCCVYPKLTDRMPLLLIEPGRQAVYNEASKRGRGDVTYRTVPIDSGWTDRVSTSSARLYGLLGGYGPIRFDWIVEESTEEPVLLEVNTNPGWRPTGNMGRIVSAAGMTFQDLVDSVIDEALDRRATSERR